MDTDIALEDPIEELYAIRRKISAQCGHDVYRLATTIAEQQRAAEAKGRKYVRLPIARVAPAEPAYPSAPEGTGLLFACEPKSPAP